MEELKRILPPDCVNTEVEFIDGKKLILHTDHELTREELLSIKQMTSGQFKQWIISTGTFQKVHSGHA